MTQHDFIASEDLPPSVPLCPEPVSHEEAGDFDIEEKTNSCCFVERVRLCARRHPVQRDGKWAWIALIAASLVQFIVMGIHNSFGVVYSQILEEFKWRKSVSAFIGSSAIGINFLLCPIGTQLCESYNPRLVTICGGTISVAGLLGSSFVSTDYSMFLSYSIVWGIGSSLCYSSTFVVVGKLFNRHLALAMGIVTAGSGLGQLAMAPSIESMLETFGWKVSMRSLSGFALCLVLAALTYREPDQDGHQPVKTRWRNLFDCSLWCMPTFLVLTIALSIFNFGYYVPMIHVPNYAKEMGSTQKEASFLISIMSIPSVISRLAFGKLADHPRVNRLIMFQFCIGIMAVSTIVCPFVSSEYAGFAVYIALFGVGEGCVVGTAPTIVADVVGRHRIAPALGLVFFSFAGPIMAGPYLAGWLFNETSRYQEAFFVAGGTMMFSVIILSVVHFLPKHAQDRTEITIGDNENAPGQDLALDQWHVVSDGKETFEQNGKQNNTDEQPLCVTHVTSM